VKHALFGAAGRIRKDVHVDYDDVVIGAGSAGVTLAARLSEDPDRRVLLVEAGPDHAAEDEADRLTNPMTFAAALTAWGLRTTVTTGRTVGYPQGRVVGGGSAVNGALALRGLPEDYDGWAAAGAGGWAWSALSPYFARLENDGDFDGGLHGSTGPLPVTRSSRADLVPLQRSFLAAATELGFGWAGDHNDPGSTGIGPFPMNRRGDVRMSTALTYLPAARGRPNLAIRTGARADRVVLQNRRAVGVALTTGEGSEVVAARRVVLCAGAIQSPALLTRSGIGPADLLGRLDIPCVVDNPFVGANLMDHPGALVHLAPTQAALCDPNGPAYQLGLRWTSRHGGFNDMLTGLMNYWDVRSDPRLAESTDEDYVFALTCGVHQPLSRGRVLVTSPDPDVPPDLDFNLLAEPADEARLLEGLRLLHALARSDGMRPVVRDLLLVDDATFTDDDALRAYLHETLGTWYHACGSCRMGPDPRGGAVVDPSLRVHGVAGLHVADASVIPRITRAATNLTVIAIAEKAADILRGKAC
jgi:choline dehydrogenase